MPCLQCHVPVTRTPAEVSKSGRVFCSVNCKHLYSTTELTCGKCGKVFRRPKSWVKPNNTNHYCGKRCTSAAQTRTTPIGMSIHVEELA